MGYVVVRERGGKFSLVWCGEKELGSKLLIQKLL